MLLLVRLGRSRGGLRRHRRARRFRRAQIQIQHTQGTAPNLTVPVNVNFVSPLVVSASQNNQLDLEFDLGASGVYRRPRAARARARRSGRSISTAPCVIIRVARHHAAGAAAHVRRRDGDRVDNTSITITKEFPTEPRGEPGDRRSRARSRCRSSPMPPTARSSTTSTPRPAR